MFNALTEEEKNFISDYIEEYCGKAPFDLEHTLRFWSTNKERLFEAFGKNLILSTPFESQEHINTIANSIQQGMRSEETGDFIYNFRGWVRNMSDRKEISETVANALFNMSCSTILASNIYNGATISIPVPDGKHPIVISNGSKVSRVLGKIAKAFNIEDYERFRLFHSRCLNTKRKGELCLSIHPLDFFTMSDNDSNWSSCMSWEDEGDYRQGTIEMMNSPCVVIGYLKSDKPWENVLYGKDYKWNNKKWRCLYIVDANIIMSIRQYPDDDSRLNEACLSWLKEISPWKDNYSDEIEKIPERGGTHSFTTAIMYNDCNGGHEHYGYVGKSKEKCCHFYSGETECLICGKEIYDQFSNYGLPTDSLTCIEHSDHKYTSCQYCGTLIIDEDNVYYTPDGEAVCEDCFCSKYETCSHCGEVYLQGELRSVSFIANDRTVGFNSICSDCFNELLDLDEVRFIEYDKDTDTYLFTHSNAKERLSSYVKRFFGISYWTII